MCWVHFSVPLESRCLRVVSLPELFAIHVAWGLYFPGWIGMASLVGLPKMITAGESLVVGSGEFLRVSMACWRLLMSRLPSPRRLPVTKRFIDFTPISALQLLWGLATELSRWWTPQSAKNFWVVWAVNSGPPS